MRGRSRRRARACRGGRAPRTVPRASRWRRAGGQAYVCKALPTLEPSSSRFPCRLRFPELVRPVSPLKKSRLHKAASNCQTGRFRCVTYSRRAERPLLLAPLAFGGRLGGRVGRAPVLLLTTTGRRSGEKRTAPVVYLQDGERMVVINTNAGNAKVPAWSLNLEADPNAEVEVGRRRTPVRARVAEGEERAELWRSHNEQYAGFDEYDAELDREPKVIVLEPVSR